MQTGFHGPPFDDDFELHKREAARLAVSNVLPLRLIDDHGHFGDFK
jgi:hypothetical protein